MGHDHTDHSHDHNNHDETGHHGRVFVIAIALNSVFVAIEFFYGLIANSTALMADAGHRTQPLRCVGVAVGVGGGDTCRLRSTSILAALANAMFLLMACGAISWEAIHRFSEPPAVAGLTVTVVAGIGIIINGLLAWLFVKGSKGDLNIRGAYLHMAADAAVSLGVVVAGVAMMLTHWYWLDPMISLIIVAVILVGTWGLLRESTQLALSGVPDHIDIAEVETYLRKRPGVSDIHDLHIWGMSTTETALTAHLVMPEGYPGDRFMDDTVKGLKDLFSLHHSTLQVELGTTNHLCSLQNE